MGGLWRKERLNLRRPVCIIGLAFLVIIIIYLYCNPLPAVSLGEADGSTLTLTGQVEKKEYRISNEQKVLVIYLREIQVVNPQKTNFQMIDSQASESQLSDVEGIICYIAEGQEPKMGSFVRISGKLRSFAEATNPGEFDARRYYQILNYQARLQNGSILEESANYDRFKEGLYQVKEYLAGLIDVCYEDGDASVMKAMLLGEKNGLDEDTKQLYQLNGVIHILSISGLHISIIGMGFYKLFDKFRLPKLINIPLSICLIYC
ncbi:MAG: ComEC/Rec2 family competence protein, partial [Lachnospiraceae bacterium]|nr:ComEC/Rec2 family competence protein [Lachnospiraceae bacterium]